MKTIIAASALVLTIALGSGPASAAGCIKGGAVGAAAGHVAGHHAVLGGAVGCVVGRHRANAAARRQRDQVNTGNDDRGRDSSTPR